MKKTIFLVLVIMLSLGASALAVKSNATEKDAISPNTESKLSEEEIARLTKRVEEIRDMDKSKLSSKEKRALKKELKEIKANVRTDGGYVYIGAGTIILIIILVILLV